jgi:hypothetical protein
MAPRRRINATIPTRIPVVHPAESMVACAEEADEDAEGREVEVENDNGSEGDSKIAAVGVVVGSGEV